MVNTGRSSQDLTIQLNLDFPDSIPFNFKPFSKVFIGNSSEYAARALCFSEKPVIPQYVQGEARKLLNQIFREKGQN